MKIGNRIRILRKINNKTLDELSKYIEVSVPTLRKMENNELFINLEITNLPEKVSNTQLYKQAGNSVSVSVIRRIAKNIKEALYN